MDIIVLALLAFGIGAALLAAAIRYSRDEPYYDRIEDWQEESWQPRSDAPRAITRIRSNQLDWEIK